MKMIIQLCKKGSCCPVLEVTEGVTRLSEGDVSVAITESSDLKNVPGITLSDEHRAAIQKYWAESDHG